MSFPYTLKWSGSSTLRLTDQKGHPVSEEALKATTGIEHPTAFRLDGCKKKANAVAGLFAPGSSERRLIQEAHAAARQSQKR